MRKIILLLTLLIYSSSIYSQADKVEVVKSSSGFKLKVNGKDFIINGMNWDYYPIGTNYSYSLWKQSDEVIMAALDAEMGLLKNMGVNTIRQYTGIQPKWITYIYQKYGIYTMINHSFGRATDANPNWIDWTVSTPNASNLPVSVNELVSGISLYPNPVIEMLHCTEKISGRILSMQGEVVQVFFNTQEIPCQSLAAGIYTLQTDKSLFRFIKSN